MAKPPRPLWQSKAQVNNPGSLDANLADLRGLREFLSAIHEAHMSLMVHADFKKRDLRAVYETPPLNLENQFIDRCTTLNHWVDSKKPPPPPEPPPAPVPTDNAAPSSPAPVLPPLPSEPPTSSAAPPAISGK